MAEQTKNNHGLEEDLLAAQLKKTNLEIAELKKPKRSRTATYVPLITTLVAVGGLVFTIYQAQEATKKDNAARVLSENARQAEQTSDRINRIEAQVRGDKERLLQFSADPKMSTASVVFLLDDLTGLIENLPRRDDERKKVTDVLGMVVWELGFDETRHIDFDVQALQRWPAYKEFWMLNGPAHHLLLSKKYYPAISEAYARDSLCVRTADFDEKRRIFISPQGNKECDYGIFPVLVNGFKAHLEIMKAANDQERLKNEVLAF